VIALTYREILSTLKNLSEEQLDQQAWIQLGDEKKLTSLAPVQKIIESDKDWVADPSDPTHLKIVSKKSKVKLGQKVVFPAGKIFLCGKEIEDAFRD